jgi:hypothetical protein
MLKEIRARFVSKPVRHSHCPLLSADPRGAAQSVSQELTQRRIVTMLQYSINCGSRCDDVPRSPNRRVHGKNCVEQQTDEMEERP